MPVLGPDASRNSGLSVFEIFSTPALSHRRHTHGGLFIQTLRHVVLYTTATRKLHCQLQGRLLQGSPSRVHRGESPHSAAVELPAQIGEDESRCFSGWTPPQYHSECPSQYCQSRQDFSTKEAKIHRAGRYTFRIKRRCLKFPLQSVAAALGSSAGRIGTFQATWHLSSRAPSSSQASLLGNLF